MPFPDIRPPLPARIETLRLDLLATEQRIKGLTPEQASGPFGKALRGKRTAIKRRLRWYEGRHLGAQPAR